MNTKCLLPIVGATALWLSAPQGCRPTGGDLAEDTGGATGSGGTNDHGGGSAGGGTHGGGGVVSSGGAGGSSATGGRSGSGGTSGSGGVSSSGGDRASGGASGSGGARSSGGAGGRGGVIGAGGNTIPIRLDGGPLDVRPPADGNRFETSTVRQDAGGVDLRDGPRRLDVAPARDLGVASTDGRRG